MQQLLLLKTATVSLLFHRQRVLSAPIPLLAVACQWDEGLVYNLACWNSGIMPLEYYSLRDIKA